MKRVEIKILQIANGYLWSKLYKKLFSALADADVDNRIFVPVSYKTPAQKNETLNVCPCFNMADRLLFFTKQVKILREIQKAYDMSKFNVIHAHTVFSGGYAAYRLWQKYKIPYIVSVRNTDVNVFFKYMLHLRHIGIDVMLNAAKVIFLSPAYRENIFEAYIPKKFRDEINKKSIVIPNGIDSYFLKNRPMPRTTKPEKYSPVRLIYVGEISSNKNITTTIKAAERLIQKGLNVKFTVVGEIKKQKYKKLIVNTPFIDYSPKCPKEEVLNHLRRADIFVMPSHTETFGLVYAEAMSQGLPVLYTLNQGFDGQFPEGQVGFHVDDRDPYDIANKILAVIEVFPAMSARCIAGAQRFNWNRIAEQYKEIYSTVKVEKE